MVPKSNQKAVHKYIRTHYDRAGITMPKGKLQKIRDHADLSGESLNAFINRAIDETIERDKEH